MKTLRKPTVAAWAVDRLAREGQLAEALELAGALRDAQDDLDAAELSRLGRQRRALVAALATQAVELAKDAGVAVSGAARDDVEKTINAAVLDAAAAAAVMTARLVKPLEAGAFEPDDLAEAIGGSVPGVAAPAPRDDLAERRARKAAEKAAREAERAANEAERELGKIETRRAAHAGARGPCRRAHRRPPPRPRAAGGRVVHAALPSSPRSSEEHADAASRARTAAKDADRARRALES